MKNTTAATATLAVLLLASLMLSSCNVASTDAKGTLQMTRQEMRTLHTDNETSQKQVSHLKKQLRDARGDLVRAQEDLANYKHVKAENGAFLRKLVEDGPKDRSE